jgi:hypothetical protein
MVLHKDVEHFPQHNTHEETVSGHQVPTLPFTAQELLGACIVRVSIFYMVIAVTKIVF